MANRLYNKQVTPKGYKKGGGVTEPAKKQAMEAKPKTKAKTKKFLKTVGKLTMPGVGAVLGGKKIMDKLRAKKMGGGMMNKRPMYKDGSLKPVDPKTQKGLSKLPTKVRNKMGFMKKGGKVNGK
jgi:hypothetical protein